MAPCHACCRAESRALHQNAGSFGNKLVWEFLRVLWDKHDGEQRTGECKPHSLKPCASDETSQQTWLNFLVSTPVSHLMLYSPVSSQGLYSLRQAVPVCTMYYLITLNVLFNISYSVIHYVKHSDILCSSIPIPKP